jgi:hypothetical protein
VLGVDEVDPHVVVLDEYIVCAAHPLGDVDQAEHLGSPEPADLVRKHEPTLLRGRNRGSPER